MIGCNMKFWCRKSVLYSGYKYYSYKYYYSPIVVTKKKKIKVDFCKNLCTCVCVCVCTTIVAAFIVVVTTKVMQVWDYTVEDDLKKLTSVSYTNKMHLVFSDLSLKNSTIKHVWLKNSWEVS